MAAFNFPNSPSVNDTYTANGVTFTWNGTIWQRTSASAGAQGGTGAQGSQGSQGTAAGLTIGTSAPGSPSAGDMWWDSDSGLFLTYYNDGNSSQWVELNQGPMGAQGAQGAQGHQGAAGAQGAQGHQGHQGSAGSNASISSNADNRVITGGSGTNLVGESNLTYDGNALSIISSANQADGLIIHNTNNSQAHADAAVMVSGGDNASAFLRLENNSQKFEIIKDANHNLLIEDDGTERFRITSDGKFGFGNSGNFSESSMAEFTSSVGGGAIGANITIRNSSTNSVNNVAELRLKTAHGVARFYKYNTNSTVIQSHSSGASDLLLYADGASNLRMHTNSSERLRITSDGDIYAGNVSGYSIWRGSGNDQRCKFQYKQTTGDNRGFALLEERGDTNCIDLFISKSRGGNGVGAINSGDNLGVIKFSGADGTRQHNGAAIAAWTSGTIATGRVPTNLSFYTAPDSVSQYLERFRITSEGKFGINYGGTPPSEDVMICTSGQASPGGLSISHLSGGNRYGARLQSISGTNKGLVISELFNSSYSDLAKVNTEFGLKADNTCKTWLCYRSEAGNEGIIDDFNVSSVTDEGTGSFGVYLDRNIHRHGNGWSQAIVFGCYNDGSRQLIAGIGYAPSHGSNNPWWDVEDNYARVNTQRSTDGVKVDAKVFNMAMFGDTGDLDPT